MTFPKTNSLQDAIKEAFLSIDAYLMLLMHFPTNLCHAGICSMAFLINLEL